MARMRYLYEDVLCALRENEVSLADGRGVVSACRKTGASDATCYTWCKKFDSVGLKDWLVRIGIKPLRIHPAAPGRGTIWQSILGIDCRSNGYNVNFNEKQRDQVLNGDIFYAPKRGAGPERSIVHGVQDCQAT